LPMMTAMVTVLFVLTVGLAAALMTALRRP
jgi:hypothetical protein